MSKKHRGRIQAQGGDTKKSVSWSQDEPLSKVDGLRLLNELENQLTERERQEREKQLANAQRFPEFINRNFTIFVWIQIIHYDYFIPF